MKDIIGYEGLYAITPEGQLWSYRRGRFMRLTPGTRGYLQVGLTKDKKQKCYWVHSLVLENFVGPRPIKHTANHKNGVKTDNNVENLEWVTHKENIQHAWRTGLAKAHSNGGWKARRITI